jgi:MFS family permease
MRLCVAQAAGTLGDQMFLVVLSWVLVSAGSAAELAAVLAVWSVARGVCLLVGGALLDRFSKRRVSLAAGALMTVITVYLAVLTAAHDLRLVPWLGAAVVLGASDGIRIPLPTTFVPFIVRPADLARSSRLLQTATWLGRAVGPALGGVIVAAAGVTWAFEGIVAWYAITTLVWATLPGERAPAAALRSSVAAALREGLSFVTRHPVLRWLLPVFAADNFFVLGPVNVLIPVLVIHGLHGTSATLGLMNAAYGSGLVLGTAGFGRWPLAARSSMRASLAMFWLADALFGALGLTSSVALAVGMYGLCGFFIGPASVLYRTYLLHLTPPELMGRVSGATRFTTFGLQPFAQMLAGLVSTLLPVTALFALAGGAGLVINSVGCARGLLTPEEALAVPIEAAAS